MREKIKIIYTMPGSVAGGGQLGTLELMDQLRQYNFHPIAVVNQNKGNLIWAIRNYNMDNLYISGDPRLIYKDMIRFISHVFRFALVILSKKISLIHLSDLSTAHYGILAARISGIQSVLHLKSLHWTTNLRWSNRLVLSNASRIVTISDAVYRASVKAGLPRKKLITIHDGLVLERFFNKEDISDIVRDELKVGKEEFVIGFVGRLGVDWKNEPLVYTLMAELSKKFEKITLLVVGGPHDGRNETFDRSKELAKHLGGKSNIRFLGNRNDVPRILASINVLLVPSIKEPLGRVVIEGMATGLPVVGSNNGGIPEMITDNYDGFLRPPDDLGGWVTIVRTLLENSELRRRIGENARKTVEERFTLRKMTEKVAKIYFELLKTK